ncbi:hypothetical protein ACVIM7_006478 [Bradyrhizobium liaoningense]
MTSWALALVLNRARAGVLHLVVGTEHLKPAATVDREVVGVAGLGQRALDVQLADRRRLDAEAEICAFRDRRGAVDVRDALHAVHLVEQIGELRARRLYEVELMLAMLFAMTSMLVCWAFMPVAAMASDFTYFIPSGQIDIRTTSW